VLVAVERFDVRIPGSGSLKEKRHVVKALKDGLRAKFNVSVAEVAHHDLWQRSAVAVAAVGGEQYHVRKVMHQIERYVERHPRVDVIDAELSLHYPEDG
jgi:uncharacterized protein